MNRARRAALTASRMAHAVAVTAALTTCLVAGMATSAAAVTQPRQPAYGPGSKNYVHRDWRVHSGGTGNDAFYVFEPVKPRPRRAPLAIVMHGYYAFSGYANLYELIRHTVRKGSVVIYPRWQTSATSPCPGPHNIEPCLASAVNGIRGGLKYLRTGKDRVKPRLARTSYFGFSFGGIITANLANRYKSLHLPRPRAMFLDDPHDGGLTGTDEPALDDDLSGIPPTTLIQCHSGADGVLSDPAGAGNPSNPAAPKQGASCNSVFPRLKTVPANNKDLILTHTDEHGTPALSSDHGVCTAPKGDADAYDWNFCWRVWDALRTCAYFRVHCRYALGDTPRHRFNGRWSDGVPIAPLTIQDAAPIAP